MGKSVEVSLSPALWGWLDLLEEHFDLLPAELLRIAETDPLKTCTLLSRPEQVSARKIYVPAGLWERFKQASRRLNAPVSPLLEQVLRQMIMQLVSGYPSPLRKNESALKRLREEVEAASW